MLKRLCLLIILLLVLHKEVHAGNACARLFSRARVTSQYSVKHPTIATFHFEIQRLSGPHVSSPHRLTQAQIIQPQLEAQHGAKGTTKEGDLLLKIHIEGEKAGHIRRIILSKLEDYAGTVHGVRILSFNYRRQQHYGAEVPRIAIIFDSAILTNRRAGQNGEHYLTEMQTLLAKTYEQLFDPSLIIRSQDHPEFARAYASLSRSGTDLMGLSKADFLNRYRVAYELAVKKLTGPELLYLRSSLFDTTPTPSKEALTLARIMYGASFNETQFQSQYAAQSKRVLSKLRGYIHSKAPRQGPDPATRDDSTSDLMTRLRTSRNGEVPNLGATGSRYTNTPLYNIDVIPGTHLDIAIRKLEMRGIEDLPDTVELQRLERDGTLNRDEASAIESLYRNELAPYTFELDAF